MNSKIICQLATCTFLLHLAREGATQLEVSIKVGQAQKGSVISFQLCRSSLRRDQGLQQIRRIPAGGPVRGQPFPELMERRLRGRSLAVRAVQLGGQAPRQRQGSAQARKSQIRQFEVSLLAITILIP